MPIRYDFYESPVPDSSERETRLHARVISTDTVDTEYLAGIIEQGTSMTVGDVKSVITSLTYQIIEHLLEGNRVYINGLGYLSLTLSCPLVSSDKEIRAESIKFKSVKFRPDVSMKSRLEGAEFKRVKVKNHSAKLSEDEIDEILRTHFKARPYISRSEFQGLCGFTRTSALRKINELIGKGKLKLGGLEYFPVYEPGEEYNQY